MYLVFPRLIGANTYHISRQIFTDFVLYYYMNSMEYYYEWNVTYPISELIIKLCKT